MLGLPDSPVCLQPPEPVDIDIVKWGDLWSYWDIAADPGYKWPEVGYETDSGKAGVGFHQWTKDRRGQFGFGGDGENTLMAGGSIAYFFRKHVQMAEIRCWSNVTLDVRRDDGTALCFKHPNFARGRATHLTSPRLQVRLSTLTAVRSCGPTCGQVLPIS